MFVNWNKMKKKILPIFVTLIISTTGLFVNERYVGDEFVYNLLMTLAISGITTAVFSLLSDLFEDKSVEELLKEQFSILGICQEYGLIDIKKSFPFEDKEIKKDFIHSDKVYILMNDGKSFFSSNTELIEARFKMKNKETNIILLDYGQADTMSVLTRKNKHNSSQDYYVLKIKEVISYHLKNVQLGNKHKLNLYLNSNYNTLAMIVTDNYAMLSIFRVSSGKDIVPHFIFRKGGEEYEKVKADIEKVINQSKQEVC